MAHTSFKCPAAEDIILPFTSEEYCHKPAPPNHPNYSLALEMNSPNTDASIHPVPVISLGIPGFPITIFLTSTPDFTSSLTEVFAYNPVDWIKISS